MRNNIKNLRKQKIIIFLGIILIFILLLFYTNKKITSNSIYIKNITRNKNSSENMSSEFRCKINENINAMYINIWEKEGNSWKNVKTTFSQINSQYINDNLYLKLDISSNFIKIYKTVNSHTNLTNYKYSTDFKNMENIFSFLDDKQKIELDKEIILFKKFGFKDYSKLELEHNQDFREVDCDKGLVVTVTFLNTIETNKNN
nr:hypothetical protein [uncultured Tyzzerella sp.]